MNKIVIRANVEPKKWWSILSGKEIQFDKFDSTFGYRVGVVNDVEYFVPKEDVLKVITDDMKHNIGIELLNPVCMPERHGEWIDLKTGEEVIMAKGSFKYIRLGVKISIPEGYEAHILPRSSTFKRYSIQMTNSQGIIETTYGEEWVFPAYAVADTMIPMGTRIAQFRLVKKMGEVHFYTTTMEKEGKTRKGLGSTGK